MASKSKVRFAKSESARKAITKQQLKQINAIYKDAYKNLEEKQKSLEGKTTYSSGVQKLYLDQFKKDMQAEMTRINAQVKNVVEDGATKIAEAVVDENNDLLKSLGLNVDGAYSYVPTNAVMQIVNGNVYNNKWSLSKSIWGSDQKNIKSIENIVAGGLAGNKSIKEISKDLMSYSKSGRAKYNAERLARTMSNHAYQKAYQMTTEKNPFIEAYQWNNGTANTCPLCIDLATQDRFGLGNGVFPKNEVPLDHPNGFCYITSIMSNREDVDKALIDWVNGVGDEKMNAQLDEFAKDMGFLPQVVKNVAEQNVLPESVKFDPQSYKDAIEQNNRQQMAKMRAWGKDWESKITSDERSAIRNYTGKNYGQINGVLRGWSKSKKWQQDIEDCRSALLKAKTPEDVVVKRVTDRDGLFRLLNVDKNTPVSDLFNYSGAMVNDKGFMSTTPSVSGDFQIPLDSVDYYIKIPQGSHAAYIEGVSQHRGEQEMLLIDDSKFVVEQIRDAGRGKTEVFMTLINEE
jgi:hypothetical protein